MEKLHPWKIAKKNLLNFLIKVTKSSNIDFLFLGIFFEHIPIRAIEANCMVYLILTSISGKIIYI